MFVVLVSKFFGIDKSIGFETFLCFLIVSVLVSKIFGIDKSIGIGFKKNWYRKKYRYRFRKFLVSKKVSVSVSKIFVIDKSIGIGFAKNLVLELFFGLFLSILALLDPKC